MMELQTIEAGGPVMQVELPDTAEPAKTDPIMQVEFPDTVEPAKTDPIMQVESPDTAEPAKPDPREGLPLNKPQLVAELAELAGISKTQAARVLDGLAYIVYREARQSIVIPGICKVDVVQRKERTCRNPRTGQMYRIAEREVVRVRPVKKAKDLITPPDEGMITSIEAPSPVERALASARAAAVKVPSAAPGADVARKSAPREASARVPGTPPAAPAAVPTSPAQVSSPTAGAGDPEISFTCKGCGVEILAPASSAGLSASCPSCGRQLTVPAQAKAPVAGPAVTQRYTVPPATPVAGDPPEKFILFSCPECKQDIEAPGSAAGSRGECPSCGAMLTVPRESLKGIARASTPAAVAAARKSSMTSLMSQTIRIELP